MRDFLDMQFDHPRKAITTTLAIAAILGLAAYGLGFSSSDASDDRPKFETISTVAEAVPVPTGAKRYPDRDEERRDQSCIDADCPFSRRAYIAPVPTGQATQYTQDIVMAAGYEVVRATDAECDPERLTCFARGRAKGIEVAASVLPLGAVPQPDAAAPAGRTWRLLYLDVHPH